MGAIESFIDAWEDDDESLASYDTHKFDKIHDAIIDTGIRPIVGLSTYEAFSAIRRFTWRSATKGHPEIREARKMGRVIANARQAKLAEHAGMSLRVFVTHLDRLKKLGWVQTMKLDGGSLAYVIGWLAAEPGVECDGTEPEMLFKDRWEKRFYTAMRQWTVDEMHVALVKDVPFKHREEFCEQYIERRHKLESMKQRARGGKLIAAKRKGRAA